MQNTISVVSISENFGEGKTNMSDAIRDNVFLFAIVAAGIVIVGIGIAPQHAEMLQVLGVAFIIAGAVGIYMMLATRQVAKKLHE